MKDRKRSTLLDCSGEPLVRDQGWGRCDTVDASDAYTVTITTLAAKLQVILTFSLERPMSESRPSTHERLMQAALSLFLHQGITETTTREISDQAEVNEVTLFRHFRSKHGLLLALLETSHGESFRAIAPAFLPLPSSLSQALRSYGAAWLQQLEAVPEFVRSLVGESGLYPPETRQALGQQLQQMNRHTQDYLQVALSHDPQPLTVPLETVAELLNTLVLGYAVLELSSDTHGFLGGDRDRFLDQLPTLVLNGVLATDASSALPSALVLHQPLGDVVVDLPAGLVRSLLLRAKKQGAQDYAIAYVLFGAGLRPGEVIALERSHQVSDSQQHLIQVMQDDIRQVPLNRWILGHRYGSHTRNPLTQWLKSRKDDHPSLFITEEGDRWSLAALQTWWQQLTDGLVTPNGAPPRLDQARQTWCIEMLMRGMSLENLSILTGESVDQLQPYARRSRERIALEQAIAIDQKGTVREDGGLS